MHRWVALIVVCGFASDVPAFDSPLELAARHTAEVDRRIELPLQERYRYAQMLVATLRTSGH